MRAWWRRLTTPSITSTSSRPTSPSCWRRIFRTTWGSRALVHQRRLTHIWSVAEKGETLIHLIEEALRLYLRALRPQGRLVRLELLTNKGRPGPGRELGRPRLPAVRSNGGTLVSAVDTTVLIYAYRENLRWDAIQRATAASSFSLGPQWKTASLPTAKSSVLEQPHTRGLPGGESAVLPPPDGWRDAVDQSDYLPALPGRAPMRIL